MRTFGAPAASTVRFALLIATVLATSAFIFLSIYLSLPSKERKLNDTVAICIAAQEADPAYHAPSDTPAQIRGHAQVSRRFQACMNPLLRDEAIFAALGFSLLFGLSGLLYVTHPWWIVWRRKLKRLPATGSSPLRDDLEQLSREMGLGRSPEWRLAPFARTTGGQAFGLPWQRYVQIDAGLAILRVTDRPGFRAVVLHELAHLRNRDVDKTYLTVSIWRAFAVVVLLPYLLFTVRPSSFVDAPASIAFRVGSLLVLIVLVYLTRNAILRVRETHADVAAASHDGTDSALQAVLSRLPAVAWWRKWGTHPDPRQRIETVRDPRLLLKAGFWELAGAGVATSLVCANIRLLVGTSFAADPNLALSVTGLIVSSPAIGLLAVAIWRATARDPAASPKARVWLGYPAALVAGYAAGTVPALENASGLDDVSLIGTWSWTLAMLLLLAGATFLAAWLASAMRGVLIQANRPLWTMHALVAVAVVVGAVWFAIWWPASLVEDGFADGLAQPPAAGAEIAWYTHFVGLTGAQFGPMGRLVFNPFTLLGLTLMWVVPLLAQGPQRARIRWRKAVMLSVAGALGVAVAGAALPFAAKAILPLEARQPSGAEGLSFAVVYGNFTVVMASVAIATVMALVMAQRGPLRPTLALLAGSLTTVLSFVALLYVADPVACYTNVVEASPAPTKCFATPAFGVVAEQAHWAILQAFLLAAPAMLLAAAVGRAVRRAEIPALNSAPDEPTRLSALAAGVVLVPLAAVNVGLSILMLPEAHRIWLERAFG